MPRDERRRLNLDRTARDGTWLSGRAALPGQTGTGITRSDADDRYLRSYMVRRYDPVLDAIAYYSPTAAGLAAAIGDASSGETIWVPAGTYSGDHTIPAGVTVVGLSREDCVLTGQISASTGAWIENLSIIRTANDTSTLIGLRSTAGTIYAINCDIDVQQAGSGTGYAVYEDGGEIAARICYLYAESSGASSNPAYGARIWESDTGETIKALSLWNGSSNDSPPANWYTVAFDDSAWGDAVEADEPSSWYATPMWATETEASSTEECLMRHEFMLPDRQMYSARIRFSYNNALDAAHINGGSSIHSDAGSAGSASSSGWITVDTADLNRGASNLIAIHGNNTASPYAWVLWELEVTMDGGEVYACSIPYAGDIGEPEVGDRSAFDVLNYKARHANDLEDATYDYHTPLSNYDATTAPTANDDSGDGYAPGSRWVDVTNDTAYVCLDASSGAAVWLEIMDVGDYDEDGDGLIDAAHGGTELDTSASDGIPHVSGGTWSVIERLSPGADSEVTISGGSITVTQLYHRVDTESDAASDDLDTISGLANDGELLILHPENDTRTVVLKHGTGNIYVPGGSDITMDDYEYHVLLIYDAESSSWCVVGAGGGSSTDEKVKVSSNDTTEDYLLNKLAAGAGISLTETNDGGDEDVTIAVDADASEITYTPTTATDWDGDADPGDLDDALDQLAERTDDLEAAPPSHASTHIDGGSDAIDGDKVEITWTPTNYTRDGTNPAETDSDDDLAAHLKGIDDELGSLVAGSGYTEGARVYDASDQTIADSTVTTVNFDTEDYDTDTIHDNSTNNTRLTCKTAGKYVIVASVYWNEPNTTGIRRVQIHLNGSVAQYYLDGASNNKVQLGVAILDLSVSDYVELNVYQDSGGNRTIGGGTSYRTTFAMQRIG